MLKAIFLLLLAGVTISIPVYGQLDRGNLLAALNDAIAEANNYDQVKRKTIDSLKSMETTAPQGLFDLNRRLYEEYKIFRFDSAYIYAGKVKELAQALTDPVRLAQANINLLFVFVSAGMYKEAAQIVDDIDIRGQTDSVKGVYYALAARYYYDLADYVNDQFNTPVYYKIGTQKLDSSLGYFPPASFEQLYYHGLRSLKNDSLAAAYRDFQTLLARRNLSIHEHALLTSTLSYIYLRQGNRDQAINYQIQAATDDIRSSTKETFAIYNLSQLLFEERDFENASFYIEKAIQDASFYGARQRKVQVSAILPIIQSSRIDLEARRRKVWITYGIGVSLAALLLILLTIIITRQKNRIALARKQISEAHHDLSIANGKLTEVNTQIQTVNHELNEVNGKLLEANKIKEEYIGYFFNINSLFFQKLERIKKSIEQKLDSRRVEEIRSVLTRINVHEEREELMKNFDKAFLKLFPHFVQEFNALLKPEEQIQIEGDEILNTDLRIYALIRLGIRENEKIAEILEYSVKSIYAYKTKIRNKALLPRDEFEKGVMNIRSL